MGQKKSSGRTKKYQGNTQDGPKKSDVILLEEVLRQSGAVNCSVVLLKDPVITAQTRALSQEGCPLQHVHIASRRLMPLHNLKLHFPIEGKSTPDHDGASSTVLRRKHLQWDLLVMPVTLEAIRTVQINFFSSGNKTFFHLSMSHVWCSLANSKRESLWHGRRRDLWRLFLFFKPFSRRCHLMVIGLQSASERALIWVENRPVSSRRAYRILRRSAGEFFSGSTTF